MADIVSRKSTSDDDQWNVAPDGSGISHVAYDALPSYEPPYMGDEPLGTCPIHGDYWTDDCLRCGR